jgi:L-ascorbate metabolism protein UlaG (beta-lactamase superfamily)
MTVLNRAARFLALPALLAGCSACLFVPATGRNPSAREQKAFAQLPNYAYHQFYNLPNPLATNSQVNWLTVYRQGRTQPATVRPAQPLPALRPLLEAIGGKPTVYWLGHSSFLIKTPTLTLLADPHFSSSAGPLPGLVKAFPGATPLQASDLAAVDVVVISHDHYDHLDYPTMRALRQKIKTVVLPKGVGSHLRRWGYRKEQLRELAWEEGWNGPGGLRITATPAHHRSNRTFEQNKTLWASFVIALDGWKIFFSGDGGYGPHFQAIGQRYGPFDLALLECGQYNVNWPSSHMQPEQTARAAADLGARVLLPVHWGRFKEAFHPWTEPVERLLPAADSLGIPVTTPMIGQGWALGSEANRQRWWRQVE